MGDPTARQQEVPRQLRKLVRGAREQCTRLCSSSARDFGVAHDGTRVEVPTARQREVPQQLRKHVSGAREQYTRVVRVEPIVHEITQWCTRLWSGARARVVHDGARDYVVVHDIAEWC